MFADDVAEVRAMELANTEATGAEDMSGPA